LFKHFGANYGMSRELRRRRLFTRRRKLKPVAIILTPASFVVNKYFVPPARARRRKPANDKTLGRLRP
jgi:hypothetical protein